jgi:hypothetical protein
VLELSHGRSYPPTAPAAGIWLEETPSEKSEGDVGSERGRGRQGWRERARGNPAAAAGRPAAAGDDGEGRRALREGRLR